MNSIHLNEHDANQGAQSSGEFLGMTGNSGWYLLGSGGATIMMVIFLWGILGVSLLLCLFIGIILCLGSLAYVFTLKNNKPEHYDTDFFESALVEAGLINFTFGPRKRRPSNPFVGEETTFNASIRRTKKSAQSIAATRTKKEGRSAAGRTAASEVRSNTERPAEKREEAVTRANYEQLQDKLASTEEQLEEALAESAED